MKQVIHSKKMSWREQELTEERDVLQEQLNRNTQYYLKKIAEKDSIYQTLLNQFQEVTSLHKRELKDTKIEFGMQGLAVGIVIGIVVAILCIRFF